MNFVQPMHVNPRNEKIAIRQCRIKRRDLFKCIFNLFLEKKKVNKNECF